MESVKRKVNRLVNELRPISVKLGVIKSADGSAEVSFGESKVLAVVHGPVGTKSRFEQINRTTLKVTVEPFNSAPSLKDIVMAQRLEKILYSVIFDLLYPRSLVSITIQPISLDGSFYSVAFNAAIAALLDSSFPMIRMAFASSCVSNSTGNLLIDTEASEETDDCYTSDHFIVFDPSNSAKSLGSNHFGKFKFQDIPVVSKFLFENGILPVSEKIQAVIREKIENF